MKTLLPTMHIYHAQRRHRRSPCFTSTAPRRAPRCETIIKHVTERLRQRRRRPRRADEQRPLRSRRGDRMGGNGRLRLSSASLAIQRFDALVAGTADDLRFHPCQQPTQSCAPIQLHLRSRKLDSWPQSGRRRLKCRTTRTARRPHHGMRRRSTSRYASPRSRAPRSISTTCVVRGSRAPDSDSARRSSPSDRMSVAGATADQVRLVLHAAFWLMHGVRATIPRQPAGQGRTSQPCGAPDQDRRGDRARLRAFAYVSPRVARTALLRPSPFTLHAVRP